MHPALPTPPPRTIALNVTTLAGPPDALNLPADPDAYAPRQSTRWVQVQARRGAKPLLAFALPLLPLIFGGEKVGEEKKLLSGVQDFHEAPTHS